MKERDWDAITYRDAMVNLAGVILGEFWDAENALDEIEKLRELLELEVGEEVELAKPNPTVAEKLTLAMRRFRDKVDTVRDLLDALPLKRNRGTAH